jgi:hypothetical protein
VKRSLRFRIQNISRVFTDGNGVEKISFGNMLLLDEIPLEFDLRYGRVPRCIFIRKCYEELYDTVTSIMLEPTISMPAVLFTGVPGIGKSIFMIYFLCKYSVDIRFIEKSFAFEIGSGLYHFYNSTGVVDEYSCFRDVTGNTFPVGDVLVVTDILTPEQPKNRAKWTLIFSSPNPKRYKEFMKPSPAFKLTFPTWSELELLFVDPDVDRWYNRFAKCGGVARIVLWDGSGDDPMSSLEIALQAKGAVVAEYFFKHGFGDVDSDKCYALVHINPPYCHEHGRWLYDAPLPDHTFASDYVFQQLKSKFTTALVAEAANWFNSGGGIASEKLGAVSAGHLFEKICLWLVPFAGRSIGPDTCFPLKNGQLSLGNITLPQAQTLAHNWKHHRDLHSNVLYQPLISNLESGDAFCLIHLNDSYMLIVLQITVGEKHPVKVNGLKDIYQAFPVEITERIERKVILFVTPLDGKLCTWQPLHNQDDKVIAPAYIPYDARNFEQWVYRHAINII